MRNPNFPPTLPRPDNFRVMRVDKVVHLTARMRRLVLVPANPAEDLDRFAVDDHLHMRLIFPPAGLAEPAWPILEAPGRIGWPGGYRMADRKYTLRRIDPAARQATVDMVLHLQAHGPGSGFAQHAGPGDLVGMAGPGGGSVGEADWHLLAGDETALPAIARILETLPVTARGVVLIEAAEEAERIKLHHPAGFDLHWLFRDGKSAGPASPLAAALRAVPIPRDGSRPFVWLAGEFGLIQASRQYFRQDCGLDRRQLLAVAYWRQGHAENPPEEHDHDQ